jgi:hypothetical protein
MAVKINISDRSYSLPTGWSEVDIEQIINTESPKECIHVLGNIPLEIVNQLSESQLFSLYKIVNFIEDEESIEELIDESIECIDISLLPWEDFEKARGYAGMQLYKSLYHICKTYYPYENKSVRLFSLGYNILKQIEVFLSHYEDMFKEEPDSDEISAGVENLNAFGMWATAYNLAGRDVLKIDQVLKMPVIEIYTALYYSYRERKYMNSLMNIKNSRYKS